MASIGTTITGGVEEALWPILQKSEALLDVRPVHV